MPKFRYKVRTREGQILTGVQEAASKEILMAGLKTSGFTPLAVLLQSGEKDTAPRKTTGKPAPAKQPPKATGRIRDEDLLMFTRELESLMRSGVPILAGLRTLSAQAEQAVMRYTLNALASDIEVGLKLSEALAKHPRIFSDVYVNSIIAGETSGQLVRVLNRLSSLLEHEMETKASVASATRYPLIVLGALVIGFTVIVNFVLPKFADFYGQLGAKLPLPSRLLMMFASFVHQYWWLFFTLGGGAVGAFLWYIRTPVGKFMWDGLLLRSPVFGPLFLKIAFTKFAATLETLYVSGVTIDRALETTALVVGNSVVSRSIFRLRESIMAGEPIAASMQKDRIFPPLVVQMIATGEQTGNLDQHLRDIAMHYDQQVKYTTKNLATLIEPILTVLLGGMILVFALAVFLPMWNMISVFKR